MSPSLLMVGVRPFTSGETPLLHFVTPYRLESVSTNEGYCYTMPAGGTIRGTWHLTGAYEDVQKVALDGFAFPLGTDLCTSLWAYTWGKVRPQLKNASNEIAAVGVPMSAIPDVSRFWTAATSNDTYLLTWENFALGRLPAPVREDADGTVNAQIELFRNGDFITRSNEVECVYRRVIEPNPIVDPINPPDPDDPTKPLYPYGPVQNLSVIEETNAYCWVDIVVDNADAWVRFEGDGASNLADPSFAAKAGETNHVVILIGKTYKVTCDMPFTVVGKSDPAIDEWWEDGNTLWLNWPVDIWSRGDDEEPPLLLMSFGNGSPRRKGFTMFVSPSGLGGGFAWTNCCCSVSGSGYYFSYNCNADCSCGGCAATGYFSYEGYRLSASGGSCGCGSPEEPHDPHDDPDDPPPPVGVSASFTKSVIFLENEYANTPSNVVPWYSDTSSLCCSALGGANGGRVWITISGDSNLIQINGQTLPYTQELQPYEAVGFTNVYKAASESGCLNEIEVTATFIENETGWSETACPKATAIRVQVRPVVGRSGCEYRHMMGVREDFEVQIRPNTQKGVDLDPDWELSSLGANMYRCPIRADNNGVKLTVLGSTYTPSIQVLEPNGIVCSSGFNRCADGVIAMELEPYITPLNVSFFGINMMEQPTEYVGPDGYFTNECFRAIWYHSPARKAGEWKHPRDDNFFFADTPSFGEYCPQPWSGGTIDWAIPLAWGELNSSSPDDCVDTVDTIYHQVFTIDASGTLKIDKFTQWIQCTAEGRVTYSPGIR